MNRYIWRTLLLTLAIVTCTLLMQLQDHTLLSSRGKGFTPYFTSMGINNTVSTRRYIVSTQPTEKSYEKDTGSGQQKIIILTYMRSGSSFTGDLLQQHPDNFYVYEPLWATQFIYKGFVNVRYATFLDNSTVELFNNTEALKARSTQVMNDSLNCRFDKLDVTTLRQFHMHNSHSTDALYNCTKHFKDDEGLQKCLELVMPSCRASRVRIIKVIRAQMEWMRDFLSTDPNLKVIHLIRDPRGMLKSQSTVNMFEMNVIQTAAQDFCPRIMNDIAESRRLSLQFPNRILTVRYEDIVDSPVEAARQLYEFSGLKMTYPIAKYIWNITYAGQPDNCVICTTRTNSTVTAYKWRISLLFNDTTTVQRECADLFDYMGYNMFTSASDQTDRRLPAKRDFYGPGLMKVSVKTDDHKKSMEEVQRMLL